MTIASHPIRPAYVGLLISLAALLAGCADQQPDAPRTRPKLETTQNALTVNSEITLYDRKGVAHSYTKTQQVQTKQTGQVVRAIRVAPGTGARTNMEITDSSATADGYTEPLTPVLGVTYGVGVANYNKLITDSAGNVYRFIATGPMIYNYPIDRATLYDAQGHEILEIHYQWSAVSGGYALLAQKEMSYTSSGALSAMVTSYVSSPVTYVASVSPPSTLTSLIHTVACYLGPKVAYAQEQRKAKRDTSGVVIQPYNYPLPNPCDGRAAIVANNGSALMVESMIEMELWGLPAYLLTWTSFGLSTWDWLKCLTDAHLAAGRCNPSTCTGGGGSTW